MTIPLPDPAIRASLLFMAESMAPLSSFVQCDIGLDVALRKIFALAIVQCGEQGFQEGEL
jgi:hypothetical protein